MPTFEYSFLVEAPLQAVAEFHRDTSALRKLTPPPTIVTPTQVEPLAEGSVSRFTLRIGRLPVRWTAVHRDVRDHGFTDIQAEGPAEKWEHTDRFWAVSADRTLIREHIEFEHRPGWRGVVTRLLFSRPNLVMMFSYRAFVTRRSLRG